MSDVLTDEQKERIAIECESLPDDEAQAEYDRRCERLREWARRRVKKKV